MLCAKCNYDNPADALFCMKVRDQSRESLLSCNAVLANPFATLRIAGQRFCDLQNAGSSPRRRILAML